jgi:hypothetical protein
VQKAFEDNKDVKVISFGLGHKAIVNVDMSNNLDIVEQFEKAKEM